MTAVGYACLYKGYGENVDIIPADELTVSLFRARHPQELDPELHSALRILTDSAKREDVERFLNESREYKSQGKEKNQRQVIFNMYRDNFTLQQIARVVDLSIDAVKQILNSDNKMKV